METGKKKFQTKHIAEENNKFDNAVGLADLI